MKTDTDQSDIYLHPIVFHFALISASPITFFLHKW